MRNPQNIFFAALITTNVIMCFGAAFPLSALLQKTTGLEKRLKRFFTLLVGIYFLECIAFTFGMCTQVYTFGLAFIWGIIFGLRWRGDAEPRKAVKSAFWFSLYTCAPTISFSICLPVMWVVSGKELMDVNSAIKFGVPSFVPWPFDTMLGFCAGLAIGTLLIKTIITTGIVKLVVRHSAHSMSYSK
jgi:hypothetical protein